MQLHWSSSSLHSGRLGQSAGVFSYRIDSAEEDEVDELLPLDVMDFIFNEINDCILGKKSLLYSPDVMMLLFASPTAGCEEHKLSYFLEKLISVELTVAAAPILEVPPLARSASAD